MADTAEALQYEIRRLRDVVERQYLELAWQQSELRSRGGKASIVTFGAGPLAQPELTENAGLLREGVPLPPVEHWPTGTVPKNALMPNCGFASYTSGNDQVRVVGINVCGLSESIVEQVTAMVEDLLRRTRSFRPVFLMDITRTEIFRRRGFSYEYFASAAEKERQFAPKLKALNASRAAFLKHKWGMAGIINFGSRQIELDGKATAFATHDRSQLALYAAVNGITNGSAAKAAAQSVARAG